MVAISPDLQAKFAKIQGQSAGACDSPPGGNVKSMIQSDPRGDKMAEIAKSIGMNERCQKQSRTFSDQSMMDSDTMAVAGGLWGVAGAASSTTVTNNVNENQMQESGCGSFAIAASTILNETANISCTLNSSLTGQTTEVNAGARITLKTVRPSQEAIKDINAKIAKMNTDLKEVSIGYPPVQFMPEEVAKNALIAHQNIVKTQADALKSYIAENPTSANVKDTKVNMTLNNSVKLKASQNITASHQTKMEDSIKKIAAASAQQRMSADLGFNASSPNSKSIIQNKVNNIFSSEKKNIEEKIQNSFTKAVSSNEILVEVEGSIIGSELNLDMMVQTSVQTSQAVKSGISIGHRVAAEMGAELLTTSESDAKAAGFDDLVREANEGLAKQIRAKGESDAATMGGMGDALGGIFSGLGLLVVLPLLIFLGVLFFAPRLVTGIIPPQLRTPLIIGIIVLIAVLIFTGFFRKSDRRRFPISSEFMSVDDELADTLGYVVTETKGQKNKMPYEDFNFTAGGTWKLN